MKISLLIIKFLLMAIIFQFKRITIIGWSMYPTLEHGDVAFFYRIGYFLSKPNFGHIVLVQDIPNTNVPVVKRIVGTPGDSVKYTEDLVIVNGKVVNGFYYEKITDWHKNESQQVELGQDEYFLLSDAVFPDVAFVDSRSFGPVSGRLIRHRALFAYSKDGRLRFLY
jgi:signal peptidase I